METHLVVAAHIVHNNKVLLIHHKKLDMWLPVGGHLEENEVPDDALLREIKEEVGIDVEILNSSDLPIIGAMKRTLHLPFHINVHSSGDHYHCCFYYLCKPLNPEKIKINAELKGFRWLSREELSDNTVPPDVRNIARKALEEFDKLHFTQT